MVFTQIWYLHKQALQAQNKGFTNGAEFTLQWRNYPIWRYIEKFKYEVLKKPLFNSGFFTIYSALTLN
jgi:hypothetical protein